jgi:catechol 2,3-dioxygenase-like lactoylglutathione lyase family enzyme
MNLGAFSMSLAVKDIQKSRDFYKKLGFEEFGGDINQNWLIMKNGTSVIGLFQGMFDKNILTFNPGWDQDAKPLNGFMDIRKIQERYLNAGIALSSRVEGDNEGPGSFTLTDPDGNDILFDQHL